MPDEIRRIEDPPEIRWGHSRSLLLTLRLAQQVLRTSPELAEDLLSLAHLDARQIIEDADHVIKAARGNTPALWTMVNSLAESIEGELDADDDADEREAHEDNE